jgi:N-acetylglucosaminyldiphosphoundecaprenol N-acetyl-beta-D-mannosaminyltransferase
MMRGVTVNGRGRLRLGHLEVDPVDQDGALGRIGALVASGRGGLVFTPNVHHVVLAQNDPEFRAAYGSADLSIADGMPVVWASRLLGPRIPERVAGSDLVLPLARRAAAAGWRLYLLGGGQGVAEEAAGRLRAETGVEIVGAEGPLVRLDGPDDTPGALDRIRSAKPHLLLVGLGAPKQEVWMHRHRSALAPAVALGLGASLDFAAGRIARAPLVVSRLGLEWLWRLGREPGRLWRRYLVDDPAFLVILARSVRDRRRAVRDAKRLHLPGQGR